MHSNGNSESGDQAQCEDETDISQIKKQNGHSSGSSSSSKIPSHQEDCVRLIGQHLRELGLNKTVDQLIDESGCRLEHPLASSLRASILRGDWEKAIALFNDMSKLVPDRSNVKEMRYLILEQKFLELLEQGDQMEALYCLQHDITPLQHRTTRVHQLPSYMMVCTPSDLRQRAAWPGVAGGSRQMLINTLQEFLPVSVMLPPARLDALLRQALTLQTQRCLFHNSSHSTDPYSCTLLEDHDCPRANFPTECAQILHHGDEVMHCEWSHNGSMLASASKDNSVIIWALDDEVDQLIKHKTLDCQFAVGQVNWSPDDTMICVCGQEEATEVIVWNVLIGEIKCRVTQSSEDNLTCCAWTADSKHFITRGLRGQFYKCNLDGHVSDSWEGVRLHAVTALSDNKTILAADTHKRVRSYNFDNTTDKTVLEEDYVIMTFTVSHDEHYLLLNMASQGIHMWDRRTGSLVRKFHGVTQSFYTIHSCFGGHNQDFIASGSEDNLVYIFKRDRSEPILTLSGHTRTVNCVAWNPVRHDCLVSASDDATIRVWRPLKVKAPEASVSCPVTQV